MRAGRLDPSTRLATWLASRPALAFTTLTALSTNPSVTTVEEALDETGATTQPLNDRLTDIATLADPGALRLLYWNPVTSSIEWMAVGSNLDVSAATLSSTGGLTAPISAEDIADGSVSNVEFQHLNGVTSPIQGQLDGKASDSHTHSASDIVSGVLDTARLGTGTADANSYLRGDGTWFRQLMVIPFHSDGTGPVILTNQANATQFLANANSNIALLDLSRFSQVRFTVRVAVASASANNPSLHLRYSPTFTTVAANYVDIGTSPVSVSLASATLVDTGWIDLSASAKGDVFVAVIQTGGDAVADPRIGLIHAHFR